MSMEVGCADLGLHCRHRMQADSQDELVKVLREHAAKAHDVPELNDTLVDYAVSRARGTDQAGGR